MVLQINTIKVKFTIIEHLQGMEGIRCIMGSVVLFKINCAFSRECGFILSPVRPSNVRKRRVEFLDCSIKNRTF